MVQDKMLTKCSKKGKIGARPIHVLLRGSAGQGLAGRDDEGHDTTLQG